MTTDYFEKKVAITGIGQSKVERSSARSALDLTIDACHEAIRDAGLTPADIGGVSTYPGMRDDGLGFSPVSIADIRLSLGLQLDWYSATAQDSPGHMSAIFNAICAIAAGVVDHVLVYRTVSEGSARKTSPAAMKFGSGSSRVWGMWQWPAVFGAVSPATLYALYAQRHFHEYGTTPEQLGQVAVNGRKMAASNPNALYRSPLTLDDYLASRFISTPLRLYDCDAPIDGSTAFILSQFDRAKDLRNPPLRFEAVGMAMHRNGIARPESFTTFSAEAAAAQMWSRTDLRQSDVDVAQIYDGFSIMVLLWLEALGFCEKGESGPFIEGGHRIDLDGELPMNTSGGQLSAGRFHGYGHSHEACVQLWGRGGRRQVRNDPQVACVSNGVFGVGCFLLTRDC